MTAPAAAAPKSTSLWEDFVDIFYAPTQVFERRRSGRFGLALVILCVLMAIAFAAVKPALQPVFDATTDRAVAKMQARTDLSPDQKEKGESIARKSTDVAPYIGAPVGIAVNVLLTGLGLWLLGKLFDAKQSFSQAAMVSTYANVPRVLGMLVSGLVAYFTPPERLTSMTSASVSPAHFLDPNASPWLAGVLSRLDPFVIWTTILLAIGLSVTGGISRRSASIVAVILWVIGSLLAVSAVVRAAAG